MPCSHDACKIKSHKEEKSFPDLLDFEEALQLLKTDDSPFLRRSSSKIGKHLLVKASLFCLVLWIISSVLTYFEYATGYSSWCLCWIYFILGIPALLDTIEDIKERNLNIDFLMTTASFVCLFLDSGREGALLLVLFSLSASIEKSVFHKAQNSFDSLNEIAPQSAFLIQEEGSVLETSIKDLRIGDLILIPQGSLVPLDGYIEKHICTISLAHLTGESRPITKEIGDLISSGSQCVSHSLYLRVGQTYENSTLTQLLQLIAQAHNSKTRLEEWIDRFGSRYSLGVVVLFFIIFCSFPFLLNIPFLGKEGSLYKALSFLIAASPCSLVLGPSIAYLSSVSSCGKQGILIKTKETFESLYHITKIAFDKTGTLTQGTPSLKQTIVLQGDLESPLKYALSLSLNSQHPLSKALVNASLKANITPVTVDQIEIIPGKGICGKNLEGIPLYLGSITWIQTLFPEISLDHEIEELSTVLYHKGCVVLFIFEDDIRPSAFNIAHSLKKQHSLSTIMLTGDRTEIAKKTGEQLHFDLILSELLPQDKLDYIQKPENKHNLAYVGDGINDAPSLAQACVGIAMGKHAAATTHAVADVILLNDDLDNLAWLFHLSKKTLSIIKQNLTFSLLTIVCASLFSLGFHLPIWLAVLLHEGTTILVSLNAIRLLQTGKKTSLTNS